METVRSILVAILIVGIVVISFTKEKEDEETQSIDPVLVSTHLCATNTIRCVTHNPNHWVQEDI